VNAGRIDSAAAAGEQLRVSWRPRGVESTVTLTVDLIVNATGPDYVLERSADPLLRSLRSAGLVSGDALNLGLRTARFGACVDAQGRSGRTPLLSRTHAARGSLGGHGRDRVADHAERLAAHLAERRV